MVPSLSSVGCTPSLGTLPTLSSKAPSGMSNVRLGLSVEEPVTTTHMRSVRLQQGNGTPVDQVFVFTILLPKLATKLEKKTLTPLDLMKLKRYPFLGIHVEGLDQNVSHVQGMKMILTEGNVPKAVYDFVNRFNAAYSHERANGVYVHPQDLPYPSFQSMKLDYPIVQNLLALEELPSPFGRGVCFQNEDLPEIKKVLGRQGIRVELLENLLDEVGSFLDLSARRATFVPFRFFYVVEKLVRARESLPPEMEYRLLQDSFRAMSIGEQRTSQAK